MNIKVHGEITSYQGGDATEYGYCNLASVQAQLKEANGSDVTVGINSPGGSVDEGFAIYSELRRYAKENKAKITTISEGQCSSIATVIFLAGDERIVSKYISPFVHNAWTYADGDAGELRRVATDLDQVNNRLAKFYAEHTKLTFEDAKELMENDTYITPEEALDIRFATKIEDVARPAALKRLTKNNNNMSKEKKIFAWLSKKLKEAKNLTVFTSTNDELIFPDLEEGQNPSVGDKATINGDPADGEYTVQSGDVYVFESGTLTEIKVKEESQGNETAEEKVEEVAEEVERIDEVVEQLEEKVEELEELVEAQAKLIKSIQASQEESDTRWNKLQKMASGYTPDDDDETGKTRSTKKETKGLAGAAKRLREKK